MFAREKLLRRRPMAFSSMRGADRNVTGEITKKTKKTTRPRVEMSFPFHKSKLNLKCTLLSTERQVQQRKLSSASETFT